MTIEVKFKKLHDHARIPVYSSDGAAGCDLSTCESCEVLPGERQLVHTGIALEIPDDYEAQVRPRSGLALKHGITVLNSPGTIDCDYRSEICVIIVNHGKQPVQFHVGDRVAQLVFAPVTRAVFSEHDDLSSTVRGAGGFGSTGT